MVTRKVENPPNGLADPRRYLSLATRHYENFPVGSWLLPRQARRHLHRIYAFARTADDLADELQDGIALAAYRADFLAHVDGTRADIPMFVDLAKTIREQELEVELFTDLLAAFAQDIVVKRYELGGLLDYCKKSADPVGRLVLRVCGYRDPRLDALSDRICTALQLLNHLQDLGADLRERDRIYFPGQDLARHGVTEAQLRAEVGTPQVRALVLDWARRLAGDFRAGWALAAAVEGRLRAELRAILRGAAAVLKRIEAVGGDVLAGRVHLNRRERLQSVVAALLTQKPPRWPGVA
ncbi:MAG: squalene synthase HpnC [Planctomycetes bacterium]|nr:squalene synthase HpnC [Planctomycetota bacterium]